MSLPTNSHDICQAIIDLLKVDQDLIDICNQIEGTTYFGIDEYLLDPGMQSRPAFVVAPDPIEEYEDEDANGKLGMIRQDFEVGIYLTGGNEEKNRNDMDKLKHRVRYIIQKGPRDLSDTVFTTHFTRFGVREEIDENIKNYLGIGLIETRRETE